MGVLSPEEFLLIFSGVRVPLYTGRGNVYFQLPDGFLSEEDQKIAITLSQDEVPKGTIKKIINIPDFKGKVPDLSKAQVLPRNVNFSTFNQAHLDAANDLIRIFMDAPLDDFETTIIYARDKVNSPLFVYAASVAILHRRREPGIEGLQLRSDVTVFPQFYFQADALGLTYQEANLPEELRKPVEIPMDYTANDLDVEHRIAYWREDVGLNIHHYHWHCVYPASGPEKIVRKDRRGELFFYMHQQMIARYNFERLNNGIAPVRRFENFRSPMWEGYFPKLNSPVASRGYPSRQPNTVLQNLSRAYTDNATRYLSIDVHDLELWRNRIMDAIHKGEYHVKDDNGRTITKPFEEATGIDILGNIVEASSLSINKAFYGDLHNSGHLLIGHAHDPDNRFKEDTSIMGLNNTSMRDPMFYPWHAFVDDIFQEYKATLAPYTKETLSYEGIKITSVQIKSDVQAEKVNEFHTFWEKSDVDVSGGLDFATSGKVLIRWTHLQRDSFTYNIEVTNTGAERAGTVRIFLAPERDVAHGILRFEDQRKLFIELDKFTITLPAGTNTILRKSAESSVTVPFEQLFGNSKNVFCSCGWPDYLLIPKGSAEGIPALLFVMISDAEQDAVQPAPRNCGCEKPAPSYCGLDGSLYPDKRAMGYPFDRPFPAVSWEEFIENVPNMFVQKTSIKFGVQGK